MVAESASPGVDVSPTPFELSTGLATWQQELERIRSHYDTLKASDEMAFNAEKESISHEIATILQDALDVKNAEIQQFLEHMRKTKQALETMADQTKAARLRALELSFKEKAKERQKIKEQQILDHFKLYETIALHMTKSGPVSLTSLLISPVCILNRFRWLLIE
jgi:hypothetical protein